MADYIGLGINLTLINNTNAGASAVIGNMQRIQGTAEQTVRSVNSLNDSLTMIALNEAGHALREVGDGMLGFGKGVFKGMKQAGKAIVETGSQFEKYRVTFGAFYDEITAKQKLAWGVDLAARTPFGVKDVVDAQIGFKAIGVEADKTFADANGNMKSFLEYVGDLGALRPDQGVAGALIGIRNGFGGNWRSFENRFDLKPSLILGRKMGDTPDEIMADIVELAQKVAPGLMSNLEGTWDQMLANLGDQFVKFKLAISDTGAFDQAKSTLRKFYLTLNTFSDKDYEKIGKSISSVFKMMWKPIDLASDVLIRFTLGLKDLLVEHPVLGKIAAGFLAITAAGAIGTGALLKFSGGMLNTVAALVFLHEAMSRIQKSGSNFDKGMGKALRGLKGFSSFLIKGSLLTGAALIAYQSNFLGFRDTVDGVSADIQDSWGYVTRALWDANGPNLSDIIGFSDLETNMARLQLLTRVIGNIFGSNGDLVNFTKREYDLLNALGLWDLTIKLTMLKGRVEQFWAGFEDGIATTVQAGKNFYNEILLPIGNWIYDNLPIVGKWIDKFAEWAGFKVGSDDDVDKWKQVGKNVGMIVGGLVTLKAGFKTLKLFRTVILSPFKLGITAVKTFNKLLLTTIARMGWIKKQNGGGTGGTTVVSTPNGKGKNKDKGGGDTTVAGLPPRSSRNTKTPTKLGKFGGGATKLVAGTIILDQAMGLLTDSVENFANKGFKEGAKETLLDNAGKISGALAGGILGSLIPGVGTAAGIAGGSVTGGFTQDETAKTLERYNLKKDADTLVKVNESLVKHYMKYGENAGKIPLTGGAVMTAPGESQSKEVLASLKEANNKQQELINKFAGPPLTREQAIEAINGGASRLESSTTSAINSGTSKIESTQFKAGQDMRVANPVSLSQIGQLTGPLQQIAAKDFTVQMKQVTSVTNRISAWQGLGTTPKYDTSSPMWKKYAEGSAYLDKPHLGLVAEDGPEAIIPLGRKRRGRGIDLWMEAGKELGILPHAEGGRFGTTPAKKQTAPSGSGGDVNIGDIVVHVPQGVTDPEAMARVIIDSLKSALRTAKLKGNANVSLEQLIAGL